MQSLRYIPDEDERIRNWDCYCLLQHLVILLQHRQALRFIFLRINMAMNTNDLSKSQSQ